MKPVSLLRAPDGDTLAKRPDFSIESRSACAKASSEICDAPIEEVSLPPDTATETSLPIWLMDFAGVAVIATELAGVAQPPASVAAAITHARATLRAAVLI